MVEFKMTFEEQVCLEWKIGSKDSCAKAYVLTYLLMRELMADLSICVADFSCFPFPYTTQTLSIHRTYCRDNPKASNSHDAGWNHRHLVHQRSPLSGELSDATAAAEFASQIVYRILALLLANADLAVLSDDIGLR